MRVACISGSRADLGGINAVYEELRKRDTIETKFIDFVAYTSSMHYYNNIDIAVLLGDRLEILKSAIDVYQSQIPIVHLSGGDITEGSQDDCMRHAITKLSHIHLPTNEDAAKRIIQMGEEPWRVHVIGYPGVNGGNNVIASFEEAKNWGVYQDDFILVVWHPNTFADEYENLDEVKCLTSALDKIDSEYMVIGPNMDRSHTHIRDHLFWWTKKRKNSTYQANLPRPIYLSLLQNCNCLIGNSSSGLYEAPSFGTPVVNVGDRQKGRIKASNIMDCPINVDAIEMVAKEALERGHTKVKNPYHIDDAASKAASIIANIREPRKLLRKRFYEIRD